MANKKVAMASASNTGNGDGEREKIEASCSPGDVVISRELNARKYEWLIQPSLVFVTNVYIHTVSVCLFKTSKSNTFLISVKKLHFLLNTVVKFPDLLSF